MWSAQAAGYDNMFVVTAVGDALGRHGPSSGLPRPFLEASGTIKLTLTGDLPAGFPNLTLPLGARLSTPGGHHVGTPLVAVRNGRVLRSGYDPVLYGNYLLIHGEGEDRSYFYAHMPRPAPVHRGERVYAGERVGAVGETGNAITVGCHLHFEIHVHGVPVDPEPSLRRWDSYS